MKTKLAIILIASAVLVSFGATKISKSSSKKSELHASANNSDATIGGLAAEDR